MNCELNCLHMEEINYYKLVIAELNDKLVNETKLNEKLKCRITAQNLQINVMRLNKLIRRRKNKKEYLKRSNKQSIGICGLYVHPWHIGRKII